MAQILENDKNAIQVQKIQAQNHLNDLIKKRDDLNKKIFDLQFDISNPCDAFGVSAFLQFGIKKEKQMNENIKIQEKNLEKINNQLFDAVREEKKIEILKENVQKEKMKIKNTAEEQSADLFNTITHIQTLKQ